MNILMALSQLEVTGAEVYATTLSDELITRGHRVTIVSDTLTKKCRAKYVKIEFNKRNFKQRIRQVKTLLKIIKEKDIQVVHAHSRASSWSCKIACDIAKIPLITTTHGKQPVHLSRKIFKAFGDQTIAVCENIKTHLINDLSVKEETITLLRNPIKIEKFSVISPIANDKKIVSIIGRLSGPKGDVAYRLLEILSKFDHLEVRLIGGKTIPEKFSKFYKNNNIKFLGFINDIHDKILESNVVIGSGRVAVEAILSKKPVIAVGESQYIGFISTENLHTALQSNFGDIETKNINHFDEMALENDLKQSFSMDDDTLEKLQKNVSEQFDLVAITDEIEKLYQHFFVVKKQYEVPVIMYHRIIKEDSEVGVHGMYLKQNIFEQHLKYLYNNHYQTITFEELHKMNYRNRFDKDKKLIILTFDDAYEDNYTNAFPMLKKYGFKAVIFPVSHLTYNLWDTNNPKNPEKRFALMNWEQIREMRKYGIEFGGHTMTHPKLSKISLALAKQEIEESKKHIEGHLREKIITFAYPYGDLNEDVKRIVKENGYQFAVSTDTGKVDISDDLLQIRRIGIFHNTGLRSFKRKSSGRYSFIQIKRDTRGG